MARSSALRQWHDVDPHRDHLDRGVSKQIKKTTDLVLGRGGVAVTTDNVHAGLTFSVMNNVGTLVGAATQLVQTAPGVLPTTRPCTNAYVVAQRTPSSVPVMRAWVHS